MRILVLGRGVIGTTYAALWAQAGHEVAHVVRAGTVGGPVHVDLLDGRTKPPERSSWDYDLRVAAPDAGEPDLVFVSVPSESLPGALETLRARGLDSRLVLFSGVWRTRAELDALAGRTDYVVGYPIAGGAFAADGLHAVLFDSVKLETSRPETASLRETAATAFRSIGVTPEDTPRMVEWLWVHQAVNAGVIAAIATLMREDRSLRAAVEAALADPQTMARGIRNIRETLRVVRARGVRLRHHARDVAPYLLPTWIAAPTMVRLFRSDELSREIMLLHHNLDDILGLVAQVAATASVLHVATPGFDADRALLQAAAARLAA